MKKSYFAQRRRSDSFDPQALRPGRFDYTLAYAHLDLRKDPYLYRVGVGEQGVLLVEPYKSELLPFWKFKNPAVAKISAQKLLALFRFYKKEDDFVGMDMARKFLQMGYTRSRRYANHASGKKYDVHGKVLAFAHDDEKAKSAEFFFIAWKKVENDRRYRSLKKEWRIWYG